MNLKQFYIGKAIGFYALVVIVCLVAAFYALNNYIYQEKQGENTYEPYRATLSGEYLCLPHSETSDLQTTECAFGLKTETEEYYAIDFYLMSQEHTELAVGTRISANGLVTPIERLSTDYWKIYPIEGIFSVTDSPQIMSQSNIDER